MNIGGHKNNIVLNKMRVRLLKQAFDRYKEATLQHRLGDKKLD